MSTNYPNQIDNFTNPQAGDDLCIVDHAGQHGDANDAIKAIEQVLGTSNGGISGSILQKLLNITGGAQAVSSTSIRLLPTTAGALGEVLTSAGPSAAPVWAPVSPVFTGMLNANSGATIVGGMNVTGASVFAGPVTLNGVTNIANLNLTVRPSVMPVPTGTPALANLITYADLLAYMANMTGLMNFISQTSQFILGNSQYVTISVPTGAKKCFMRVTFAQNTFSGQDPFSFSDDLFVDKNGKKTANKSTFHDGYNVQCGFSVDWNNAVAGQMICNCYVSGGTGVGGNVPGATVEFNFYS
jgi:hypothetical protein